MESGLMCVWEVYSRSSLNRIRIKPMKNLMTVLLCMMMAPEIFANNSCLEMTTLKAAIEQESFKRVNLDTLREAVKQDMKAAFEVDPRQVKSLEWNGPERPKSIQDLSFQERLTEQNLRYSKEQYDRTPIDELIGITLQVGVGQGERIRFSSEGWRELSEQSKKIADAIARKDEAAFLLSRKKFEEVWAKIEKNRSFGPMEAQYAKLQRDAEGKYRWPRSRRPIEVAQFAEAITPVFLQAAQIRAKGTGKFEDVVIALVEAGARLENRLFFEGQHSNALRVNQILSIMPNSAPVNWQLAESFQRIVIGSLNLSGG
jgi:hypothetical protein